MKSSLPIAALDSPCASRESTSFSRGDRAITECSGPARVTSGSASPTFDRITDSSSWLWSSSSRETINSGQPRYADTKQSIIPVWVERSSAARACVNPASRSPSRIATTARAQCAVIVPSTPIDVSSAAFASSRACLRSPDSCCRKRMAAQSARRARSASRRRDRCARARSLDRRRLERCRGASGPQMRPDTPPGLPTSAPDRLPRPEYSSACVYAR